MHALRAIGFAVIAAGLFAGQPASAQTTTGINVTVADWLPLWDAQTGGWGVVATGTAPLKFRVFSREPTAAVPPGTYDLYWIQDADHDEDPMRVAEGVTVRDGAVANVQVSTGIAIVLADWVHPLGDTGFWGVTPREDPDGGYANWVFGPAEAMVLPPGEYDLWWDVDDTDDVPAIWLDTALVGGFGGLGVGVQDDGGAVAIVGVTAGGAADNAGLRPGDIITIIDGRPVEGMGVDAAVALLRGAVGTPVALTVARAGGPDLSVTAIRQQIGTTEFAIGAGIRAVPDAALPPLAATGGYWGVVFAGDAPDDLITRAFDTDAPLLVGYDNYDIYWVQDPDLPPRLIASRVTASPGVIVEVPIPPPAGAPAKARPGLKLP